MKKSGLLELRDGLRIKYNEFDFSIESQNAGDDDDISDDLYEEVDEETRPASKEEEKYNLLKKEYDFLVAEPIKSVFKGFLWEHWMDFLLCVCWGIALYFNICAALSDEYFSPAFLIFPFMFPVSIKPLVWLFHAERDDGYERFKFVLRIAYVGCIAIGVILMLVPSASVRIGALVIVCSLLICALLRIMEVFEKPHRLGYLSNSNDLRHRTERLQKDIIYLKDQYEWIARMISFGCQLILVICTWLILVHFKGNPFS